MFYKEPLAKVLFTPFDMLGTGFDTLLGANGLLQL